MFAGLCHFVVITGPKLRCACCVVSLCTMTSGEEGPYLHEYVVRFGDEAASSTGFQIVSPASLVGSEVAVWGRKRDGPMVISIIDPVASSELQHPEPAPKRLRGVLEPKMSERRRPVPTVCLFALGSAESVQSLCPAS